MVVLVAAFLVVLIVVLERALYFRKILPDHSALNGILDQITGGDIQQARARLAALNGPMVAMLLECLDATQEKPGQFRFEEADFDEARGRSIATSLPVMERYLNLLATLGNISPFIGLLGTVLGIIRAFLSISDGAAGNMAGLNAGIAEALVTTAAGLAVAIPSVVAYNVYRGKIDTLLLQMEVWASRVKSRLKRSMVEK